MPRARSSACHRQLSIPIGRHPFTPGAAVGHHVVRIEVFVQFALLAEAQHRRADGCVRRGEAALGDKVANDWAHRQVRVSW